MKVAIIGSRNLQIDNIENYLPSGITEIVSGGAKGIDTSAEYHAKRNNIKLTQFLPQYNIYGKAAPLKRNIQIIEYSDLIIAFWNGYSKGTKFVIENAKKINKPIKVIIMKNDKTP